VPPEIPDKQAPRIWCLLGHKAGDNTQVTALADALGCPWTPIRIHARPWELATNLALRISLAGIDRRRSSELAPPWPELIISAGRRNEPVARWIQARSGGRTRLVHIGRPWAPLAAYDLIVTTPQYSLPDQANILHNTLPLQHHDSDALTREAAALAPQLSALAAPRIALLLGGDSGKFVFTAAKAQRLGALATMLAQVSAGSIMLTSSPRTPEAAITACVAAITAPTFIHRWSADAANPYRGILGSADAFIVTGESMSMLAEASALHKPLYIFDMADEPARPWWRHAHAWRYKPLSHRVAMRIAPRRMRRDIGLIQNTLVSSGSAQWLNPASASAGLPAPRQAVAASHAGSEELINSAKRVKGLLYRD